MKLSVSLSERDVELLDAYARDEGLASRSAAVQRAVDLLRHRALEQEYEIAWSEWSEEDAAVWDQAVGDGL